MISPQVFTAEFGDAPLAVMKDPRICRFLPLWLEVLARLGVAPKAVVPLATRSRSPARSPGATACPRTRRCCSGCATASRPSTPPVGCREASCATTTSSPTGALPPTGWRRPPDLRWPVPPDAAAPAIEAFLSGDMRHHDAGPPKISAAASPSPAGSARPGRTGRSRRGVTRRGWPGSMRCAPRSTPPMRLMGTAARRQRAAATDLTAARRRLGERPRPPRLPPPSRRRRRPRRRKRSRRYAEQAAAAHDELTRPGPRCQELADGNAQTPAGAGRHDGRAGGSAQLDLLEAHRPAAGGQRPDPPHPPGPTSAAENLSRRNPAAPRRVLRLAGKSGHIPHGSSTPERSLSGTPGRSDLGCVSRLIVQAKKLSRFLFPGPPAARLYPQGAGERPLRPRLLHHPPPEHALDFPALSGPPLRHHRRARASEAEPGFRRLDLPALQPRTSGTPASRPSCITSRSATASSGSSRSCPSRSAASPARCRGSATARPPPPTSRSWPCLLP